MIAASVAERYTDLVTTGFATPIEFKAWFATIAIVLAVVQITTAARIYGKLPLPVAGEKVAVVHRWSGRLAFLCTLPVAFHCVFILGFQTTDARVAVHSVVGSFLYGAFAVKVLFVRSHRYPWWALPLAGGSLFATLAAIWLTSSLWYWTSA